MDAVVSAWSRITHWLEEHAPDDLRRLRPPADDDTWADVLGVQAPADLVAFFRVQGGGEASVLPFAFPLGAAEAVREAVTWRRIQADTAAWAAAQGWPRAEQDAGEAGSRSWDWLPEFVPIANDGAGNCLFVDTRPGSRSGCVTHYDHEQGALDEPRWESVTAMLDDVADALEVGRPSAGREPYVDDGHLGWAVASWPRG